MDNVIHIKKKRWFAPRTQTKSNEYCATKSLSAPWVRPERRSVCTCCKSNWIWFRGTRKEKGLDTYICYLYRAFHTSSIASCSPLDIRVYIVVKEVLSFSKSRNTGWLVSPWRALARAVVPMDLRFTVKLCTLRIVFLENRCFFKLDEWYNEIQWARALLPSEPASELNLKGPGMDQHPPREYRVLPATADYRLVSVYGSWPKLETQGKAKVKMRCDWKRWRGSSEAHTSQSFHQKLQSFIRRRKRRRLWFTLRNSMWSSCVTSWWMTKKGTGWMKTAWLLIPGPHSPSDKCSFQSKSCLACKENRPKLNMVEHSVIVEGVSHPLAFWICIWNRWQSCSGKRDEIGWDVGGDVSGEWGKRWGRRCKQQWQTFASSGWEWKTWQPELPTMVDKNASRGVDVAGWRWP